MIVVTQGRTIMIVRTAGSLILIVGVEMVNRNIVGRVESRNTDWYKLSDDTIVSFHVAYTNRERSESVMLVSDSETWPSITAERLGLKYTFMRNATENEINDFMLRSGISLASSSMEEE